jgi:multisubunit Na+/H+ antiporter MnhG subunit
MSHKRTIFIILSLIFFIDAGVFLMDLQTQAVSASASGIALFMIVANAVGAVVLAYGAYSME